MPTTRHNQTYRQENKKAFCAKKRALLIFNGGAKGSVGIYFWGDNVGLYDCGNPV